MEIKSAHHFITTETASSRIIPEGTKDPRIADSGKPGIRIYGRGIGKILSFFGFAVILKAPNESDQPRIWYCNSKSLNLWKERQIHLYNLENKPYDFSNSETLDRFIQDVKNHMQLQPSHTIPTPSKDKPKTSAPKEDKKSHRPPPRVESPEQKFIREQRLKRLSDQQNKTPASGNSEHPLTQQEVPVQLPKVLEPMTRLKKRGQRRNKRDG